MKEIFVNLKRFEVPRSLGGLCPSDDPIAWIEGVMVETVQLVLGGLVNVSLTYLLPESLIRPAIEALDEFPASETRMLSIGCQGVHWEDIQPEGNFGAFTSSLPASAAKNLGSNWAIIGHSEERRAKSQIINQFNPQVNRDEMLRIKASESIDRLVNAEVHNSLRAGLNVLLCVGETAEERGGGNFEEQKIRIEVTLRNQLLTNLEGIKKIRGDRKIVIAYEPIWALTSDKIPPPRDYISFVTAFIKRVILVNLGIPTIVVYGGDLSEEEAGMIAEIETIDGCLLSLTQFEGQIGFEVKSLKTIVDKFLISSRDAQKANITRQFDMKLD
jgi:triosephosphate isomerase